MRPALEIRVLGELEVLREGKPLQLPASKKTRALLGHLVVLGVVGAAAQPRQRLCELFWDGPDDPRAALRWSLTKLRPVVDDATARRLVADREHVALDRRDATVDLAIVRHGAGSIPTASLDALRSAAAQFRGELLEGLDLPECYRYHEWCIAQREAARQLRGSILDALTDRLGDVQPEEALRYARARVTVDPLGEAGHVAVLRLLARLGRPHEALQQYERCRRILEAQLGRRPSAELEAARSLLGQAAAGTPARVPEAQARAAPREGRTVLFGRRDERAVIADAVRRTVAGSDPELVLFAGEPGIGKTRLLEETADRMAGLGGVALFGRAFEAEMVRPYGAWIDALRSAPPGTMDGAMRADLAPLLPELGAVHDGAGETADRNRLFDAVARVLRSLGARAPVVLGLDDVQWFDEASAALLHFVSRSLAGARVLVACAARAAEIDDNPPVRALLHALLREGRLARIDLVPLDAAATRELVGAIDGDVDAAQIFADAGGNPLFSLELARAFARGDGAASTPTLDGLIAERLSHLDERTADLLPWAAALGHLFPIDTLATVTSLPVLELLSSVEELERHGVLRVASSALGSVGYDFAHDLVRRAAYRSMSEPRRRWVHLQIARGLGAAADPEGTLAGDIAHHAALGGDHALAARAYVAAAERSLRLFANADANRLATSGMPHASRLAPELAVRARLALLSVQTHSNQWLRRSHELEAELSRLAVEAQARGMAAEASRCFYLVSFVHNERGDFAGAGANSMRAAQVVRAADVDTRLQQLANTGRCLALIERDVARAEEFLREAECLRETAGETMNPRTELELTAGMGLLHAFKGQDGESAPLLERAAEVAAALGDQWLAYQSLARLAAMALDRGRAREALDRCVAMGPLVARLVEGSEGPFVAALAALARLALGDPGAPATVQAAIATLRAIDSKAHLAYALDTLAEHDLREGRPDDAHRHAGEALAAAEVVGQRSEAAVARALLARIAIERGRPDDADRLLHACAPDLASPMALSARARDAVARAAEGRQTPIATPTQNR